MLTKIITTLVSVQERAPAFPAFTLEPVLRKMYSMLERLCFTLCFAVLFFARSAEAQVLPTPIPAKPEPAKTNTRPAPAVVDEPFDRADVKTLASKCVTFETEAGDIEAEMYPESAPESVRNFLNLVAIGALDTTTFSRVVPGFVIQGGNIWTRTGGVSRELGARARRPVQDEPNKILHERGVLSMARSDEPNSATTSFFILVGTGSHLDGKFAAFGRVTKGLDVADLINKASVVEEKPDKPVRIKKASIFPCVAG